MKKRLTTFNIMGHSWKVISTDRLPEHIDGLTTFDKRTIEISSKLEGHDFATCLIHELGHGVLYELGMHLTGLSPEVEELLVDAYAKSVCKNFSRIKKLIK